MEFIVLISAAALMVAFYYVVSKDIDEEERNDADSEISHDFKRQTRGMNVGDYYISSQEDQDSNQIRVLRVFPDKEVIGRVQYLDIKSGRVFTDDLETFQNTYKKL